VSRVERSNPLENESALIPRVGKKTKALMFLDRWAGIIDPATKYREFIATKNTKQILIGAAYKPPLFLCLFVAKIFAVKKKQQRTGPLNTHLEAQRKDNFATQNNDHGSWFKRLRRTRKTTNGTTCPP